MKYKKEEDIGGNCLQCGTAIYGRKDKKFCSEDCKNHYHNAISRETNRRRTRVIAALTANYEILNGLLRYGVQSYGLEELRQMGFREEYITGYRKGEHHHNEHSCFDIKYYVTGSKIFGIRKDGLNIP